MKAGVVSGRVKRWEGMEDLSLSDRVVRGIHMVLRQAVNERIINHNPRDNCRIPKLEKKERKIIPPEQIGVYLQQAKVKRMLPMFYLEPTSGLRRGELLALLRAAGIDDGGFHGLGHMFASLPLQNGADVKTLSNTLGHYSAGFTLDTYTHVTQRMKREAADTIGSVIDQAM